MELSDVWMIAVFLSLFLYTLLDGYDLGIGTLTLIDRNTDRRRELHRVVSWVWDGNESWLVLLALTLWAGVPVVTGVALPALYVAVIPMLWSLIARGVSLELIDQHEGWPRGWGALFGIGSVLAAFVQGAAFGGIVAGLPSHDGTFTGGPFTFLHHGYAVLTGLTAVVLYLVAGCAWAVVKTDGETRARAARVGRIALIPLSVGTVAAWVLAPVAGPVTLHPGDAARLPVWIVGAAVLGVGALTALRAFSRPVTSGRSAAFGMLAVYVGGLTVAIGLLYPTLVPPNITVHNAASPHSSLLFLIIGVGLVIPVILTYQAFGYWVFRGKIHSKKEVTA